MENEGDIRTYIRVYPLATLIMMSYNVDVFADAHQMYSTLVRSKSHLPSPYREQVLLHLSSNKLCYYFHFTVAQTRVTYITVATHNMPVLHISV